MIEPGDSVAFANQFLADVCRERLLTILAIERGQDASVQYVRHHADIRSCRSDKVVSVRIFPADVEKPSNAGWCTGYSLKLQ